MDKNDTETIVRDFLNLWQKQFAHMSRDSESAQKGFEAFREMQEAYKNLMGAGKKNDKSATASDIFGNIGNEFIKLAESHAELERRVARIERQFAEGGPAPAKSPKPKTPAGTRKRTK